MLRLIWRVGQQVGQQKSCPTCCTTCELVGQLVGQLVLANLLANKLAKWNLALMLLRIISAICKKPTIVYLVYYLLRMYMITNYENAVTT